MKSEYVAVPAVTLENLPTEFATIELVLEQKVYLKREELPLNDLTVKDIKKHS